MNENTVSSLTTTFVSNLESIVASLAQAEAKRVIEAAFSNIGIGAPATNGRVVRGQPTITKIAKPGRKPGLAKTVAAVAPTAQPIAKKGSLAKAKVAKKGKRVRRSPADLDRDVGRLVSFVKKNSGITNEKARAALGMEKQVWLGTVSHALQTKQLTKKGVKRSTTLHAK